MIILNSNNRTSLEVQSQKKNNRNDLPSIWASQVALVVKTLPANARDVRNTASIPGLGRSFGRGHDNYSILPWRIPLTEEPGRPVHRVKKSQTQLSD